MTDFKLCTTDYAAMQTAYQSLGYWSAEHDAPINQGPLPDNSGDYYLLAVGTVFQPTGTTTLDDGGNAIPDMTAVPGYWSSLRINGNNPFGISMSIPDGLTVYYLSSGDVPFWTADGVTPAPSYVASIGVLF